MNDVSGENFTVGAVVNRSFIVLARKFVPFLFIALLFYAPIALYSFFIDNRLFTDEELVEPWSFAVVLLIYLLIGYLAMATLVHGTMGELQGKSVSIGESLTRGLSCSFPVLAIAILGMAATIVGFVLLVVPGFIVWVYTAVVIPVAVVEGLGVVPSFQRSIALTAGRRWRVFGLTLIFLMVSGGLASLNEALSPSTVMSNSPADADGIDSFLMIRAIAVDWVLQGIGTVYWAVFFTVLYHDLRVSHEGPDDEEIAAVFE